MKATHEIYGYLVVLPHVRNVYPAEEEYGERLWHWGFKYTDGFFENFVYRSYKLAVKDRKAFVEALDNYWWSSVAGRG